MGHPHNSKLEDIVRSFERKVLEHSLELCGTQVKAATMLGLDHSRFCKLVAEYGLNDKESNLKLTYSVHTMNGGCLGPLNVVEDMILVGGVPFPELPTRLKNRTLYLRADKGVES